MEITLNLWQIVSAIAPVATFLGWASVRLISIGKTWEATSITIAEMSRNIDHIRSNESQINNRIAIIEAQNASFVTRMELLETMKRIELLAMTLVPASPPIDLTTPLVQAQQREIERRREKGNG